METLTQILADWGCWGLFVAALVAGSILPFSSEAVLLLLLSVGADPVECLIAAAAGNTLGGMTCYWIGTLGRPEWIARIGIGPDKVARARRFVAGRGAAIRGSRASRCWRARRCAMRSCCSPTKES